MLYSKLFGKTVREAPKDATLTSHKLLYQAGYIRELSSGRYMLTPLGFRVEKKIIQIIDEEMERIGSQRLIVPTFHPLELWQTTHRDEVWGEGLSQVTDRRGVKFAVGATAEAVMVEFVKKFHPSWRDLPIVIHQFSNKFRDELRARGGLLRTREFLMKDAYSFAADEKSFLGTYWEQFHAYEKIAQRLDLQVIPVEADSGALGGDFCHEFMVPCDWGEDTILTCECGYNANKEKAEAKEGDICGKCRQKKLKAQKGIEFGHVFKYDDFYTKAMGCTFTDKDGKEKYLQMGAYGIGIGRAMAIIAEIHHDEKGLIWPRTVAPYQVHLISMKGDAVMKRAMEIYIKLKEVGIEVLYDDRDEISAGVKFSDADLIGIPVRLVVSEKTGDKIEYKERANDQAFLFSIDEVLQRFL